MTHYQKALLTTWLVDQRRLGNKRPEITTEIIERVKTEQRLQVINRTDRTLEYLEKKSSLVGDGITYQIVQELFNDVNLSLEEECYLELLAVSECISANELEFLIRYLEQRAYIEVINLDPHRYSRCILTVAGYERLEALSAIPSQSTQAFVAMWFHDSMQSAWEKGISPGIRDAGYEPLRIDQKEHANKIDDEIIAEIRKSRFLVADFTQGEGGARGRGYYEAGFADGLNIPIVFTCHSDSIDTLHFDTRQYNHITWKTPEELREALTKRICAVIGQGPGNN